MSIQDTNPSVFFGGTWERIAKGKTLVGVDENDTDFNVSSKTGGEKSHILTVDETPSHTHTLANNRGSGNQSWGGLTGVSKVDGVTYDRATTSSTGGDQPHNNLQPYYTCYIFVRTA